MFRHVTLRLFQMCRILVGIPAATCDKVVFRMLDCYFLGPIVLHNIIVPSELLCTYSYIFDIQTLRSYPIILSFELFRARLLYVQAKSRKSSLSKAGNILKTARCFCIEMYFRLGIVFLCTIHIILDLDAGVYFHLH